MLSFVSLNMRGIRKILKKLSKHVPPSAPMPGYVALEIDHPHEPEKRLLSVQPLVDMSWIGVTSAQCTEPLRCGRMALILGCVSLGCKLPPSTQVWCWS